MYVFLWVLDCVSHTRLAAPHHSWNVRITMNETQTVFMLTHTKKQTFFKIILDFICLKFLDQKFLLQLFLNCETFVRFLAVHFRSK